MPRWSVFASPVTTPASKSSTTPSENISVWIPRSRFSFRKRRTASGISPMPICSVEPSSMSSATFCADRARHLAHLGALRELDERPVDLDHVGEARDVDEGVAERARHAAVHEGDRRSSRVLGGRLRALDADAVRAEAVLVGRRDVDERHVHGKTPVRDRGRGISERKTGTKSARPSFTAGAHVRAREERRGGGRSSRSAGRRGPRSRRSSGASTSTSRSSAARATIARTSSSGLLQPAWIQTWSPERIARTASSAVVTLPR